MQYTEKHLFMLLKTIALIFALTTTKTKIIVILTTCLYSIYWSYLVCFNFLVSFRNFLMFRFTAILITIFFLLEYTHIMFSFMLF